VSEAVDVLEHVLMFHEWCSEPKKQARCGHQVDACTDKTPCDGCAMRKRAGRLLKTLERRKL
jgi:hypothetical protein